MALETPDDFVKSSHHYNSTASVYDQLNAPNNNTAVSSILKYLPITSDDIIVDIGGGTGDVAHRVWKEAKLKNPIFCVDPSQEMLEFAKELDGIETYCATAEEFFTSKMATSKPFTKVIMCGCTHLFTDRETVYSSLKTRLKLPTDQVSCIVIYLSFMSPLVPTAAENFKSGFLQNEVEIDTKVFDKVGLKWKLVDAVETHPVSKSDWYDFHRNRMLRCIRPLSDSEIEEGILELEGKYGNYQVLNIDVHFKVITLEC